MSIVRERRGDVLLYTARDRRKFLVYDVESINGKGKRVTLGSLRATHRVFKPPAGAKLAYRFHDDQRELSDERLANQLASAGWIGSHLYNGPGSGNPR